MKRVIALTTPFEAAEAAKSLNVAIAETKASSFFSGPAALSWESSKWDLSDFTTFSSPTAPRPLIHFGPLHSEEIYYGHWAEASKLLFCEVFRKKSVKNKPGSGSVRSIALAVRYFIDELQGGGLASITEITKAQFEDIFREAPSYSTIGNDIIEALVARSIAPQLRGLKITTDRKGYQSGDVQPVSWDGMVAVARTFALLESEDSPLSNRPDFHYLRSTSAMVNLLACAPARIAELWRLPYDTAIVANPMENPMIAMRFEGTERDELDFKFAMTWFPGKGGKAVIKPVPGAMQPVAKRCLEILAKYSEKPRELAAWIMEHPGKIPLPKELEACRQSGRIRTDELKVLFGVPADLKLGSSSVWLRSFKKTQATLQGSRLRNDITYCLDTLESEWWAVFLKRFKKACKSEWPYVVNSNGYKLTADRALLLFFDGHLNPRSSARQSKLFFQVPGALQADRLLGQSAGTVISFWDRLEIRLPNGESPDVNTHQIRHFLNTVAQRANLPQPIIAMWSGRADIAQNATYDHRTDAERLRSHGYEVSDYDEMQVDDLINRQIDDLYSGSIGLPSVEVLSRTTQTMRELRRNRVLSITQFGYCMGDLHSEPCPHAVNCLSCARLVVCKGASKATAFIEQKLKLLTAQRDELQRHIKEDGGWQIKHEDIIPQLNEQIRGAQDLLLKLNDPDIEDGAILARRNEFGAQMSSISDRAKSFIEQRKLLDAEKKEIADGQA